MGSRNISIFPTSTREQGPAGDPLRNKIFPWVARDNEKQQPILDPTAEGISIPKSIQWSSMIGRMALKITNILHRE